MEHRTFTCPDCQRQTTYDPKECWAVVRFSPEGSKAVKHAFRRVRCPLCGRDREVPEVAGAGVATR